MNSGSRVFGVIPAAGLSRRMGRSKLMMPWGDRTVIGQLLHVLTSGGLAHTVVVLRRGDAELAEEILRVGDSVSLVQPEVDPPDMRASVEHGLRWISERLQSSAADGWLLCPADHPLIEPTVLAAVLEAWRKQPDHIVIPTYQGRRGHPSVLPWRLAPAVFDLPPETGLNVLIRREEQQLMSLPVATESILADLDTPEDYDRWRPVAE